MSPQLRDLRNALHRSKRASEVAEEAVLRGSNDLFAAVRAVATVPNNSVARALHVRLKELNEEQATLHDQQVRIAIEVRDICDLLSVPTTGPLPKRKKPS